MKKYKRNMQKADGVSVEHKRNMQKADGVSVEPMPQPFIVYLSTATDETNKYNTPNIVYIESLGDVMAPMGLY
jgi:hypothetical protein